MKSPHHKWSAFLHPNCLESDRRWQGWQRRPPFTLSNPTPLSGVGSIGRI